MKDLPHGETQYDPNEKETFEAMALRVAKKSLSEHLWLDERVNPDDYAEEVAAVVAFATRIHDELCKRQEPVGYVYTDLTEPKATKKASINADIPNGTLVFLHSAPIPADMAMMPREPTAEMMKAFKAAFAEGSIWTDRFTAGIEAMLAAYEKEQGK
jgi:hypothetical protein